MNNATIIKATTAHFDEQVLKNNIPVLVDFWAEWCGPCRAQNPILEEVAEVLKGKVAVAKVNIEENQTLAEQFSVTSIPTLLIFNRGEVVRSLAGVCSKDQLLSVFKELKFI
jgi:thioredoxin